MSKAKLIAKEKVLLSNGCIAEFVVWELPIKTQDRPHGYKYRLYYGDRSGKCLVRYDNETGKGDHKHIGAQEFPYRFVNLDALFRDFDHDIDHVMKKHKGEKK
jgi:Family of unknown function (DUF6516)